MFPVYLDLPSVRIRFIFCLPCWPVRVPHNVGGLLKMLPLEVPPVIANFVSEQSAVVEDVPDTGCCNETAVKSSRIWQISEKR